MVALSLPRVAKGLAVATSTAAALSAQGFNLHYNPPPGEVVLDTDSTLIQPTAGPPVRVAGGVFQFASVTIGPQTRVRGVGSRPMVWIVLSTFRVQGHLTVDGQDGTLVNTLNSASFPNPGGRGHCGGGDGGAGSPNATFRSVTGGRGSGPFQWPGGGGRGGLLDCLHCGAGSGGGGGSMATQGDPWYKILAGAGTAFQQQLGIGGQGCSGASGWPSRALAGGAAGPRPFFDGRHDNDFWGVTVDVFRNRVIVGELPFPMGGGGGGGGGDRSVSCAVNDPNFVIDDTGGGGGGGGGVLMILCLGDIIVEPTGLISADGGHGGGGEQAGSSDQGGGGGGGAGGTLLLGALGKIVLHAHGETYANNDYDFALSADGGISRTGTFGTPVVPGKYPRNGALPLPGVLYDSRPLGGFGGMGTIQLLTKAGGNTDGTNTILDDRVDVIINGQRATGALKQRYLAWRGFPNQNGVLVDDFGNPTAIGASEGDLRPSPILMPILF